MFDPGNRLIVPLDVPNRRDADAWVPFLQLDRDVDSIIVVCDVRLLDPHVGRHAKFHLVEQVLEIRRAANHGCVAVGKFGPISRVLSREAGSVFIYAPLRHALYDGQLTLGQLRRPRDF